MLVNHFIAKPICHFLGYLYPAYESYKAVKLNDPSLHTQWLTFWIVSTYFSFVEMFGDTLLSWLPFYYETKVALLVWLVLPQFKGATKIYEKLLNPYLHRYERDIDEGVAKMKRRSAKQLASVGKMGMNHIRSQSAELIKVGTQLMSASSQDLLGPLKNDQEETKSMENQEQEGKNEE